MLAYGTIRNHKEFNIFNKRQIMNIKNYLTVRKVSKRIGLTEERVRELINLKQIKATKIGRWWVKPEDLEAFIESRSNRA